MTSVDEIFKKPKLPQGTKRKLAHAPSPDETYKASKHAANGDAKGKMHQAEVEEADDDIAGPQLPPDLEDAPEDDEEGRFYGGGVSKDTADVLDYIEERDGEETAAEQIDTAWLKRTALNFEKKINRNAELRAKFEADPQKFMSSEADLDAEVKTLSVLTDHPDLYPEVARLGTAESLVSLLAHENTDIAIDTIEVIAELTDEDVQAEEYQWQSLVDALLEADLPSLLVQNFERLDESIESDRNGIYHSLSLVENLASQANIVDKLIKDDSILTWLLNRMNKKENPVSQNKQYAAEVLAILLQTSTKATSRMIGLNAVDEFLQILSAYRKRDPEKDSEEEEFAENTFDCLTCLIDQQDGKLKFVQSEGVELCLIMLREGKFSKPRALRLLDHALGGQNEASPCEKLVEAAGLKTIFGIFMKAMDHTTAEHILGIFSSLLRLLPSESAARIRTLAKFVEKDFEKVSKLVSLRMDFSSRLAPVEQRISREAASLSREDRLVMEAEWLSLRLDAGLYSLQTVDVILAWLNAEDLGAHAKIKMLLEGNDLGLNDIKATLEGMLRDVKGSKDDDAAYTADMLNALVGCII